MEVPRGRVGGVVLRGGPTRGVASLSRVRGGKAARSPLLVRGRLSTLNRLWGGLTDAARAAWQQVVDDDRGAFPDAPLLGQSGRQFFLALNLRRLRYGFAPVLDPAGGTAIEAGLWPALFTVDLASQELVLRSNDLGPFPPLLAGPAGVWVTAPVRSSRASDAWSRQVPWLWRRLPTRVAGTATGSQLDDLLGGGELRFPLPDRWRPGDRGLAGVDVFDDLALASTRLSFVVRTPQPGFVAAGLLRPRFLGLTRPVWWVQGDGTIGTVDAGDPADVPVTATLGAPPVATLGDLESWLRANTIFELIDVPASRLGDSVADVPPRPARVVLAAGAPDLLQIPA